MVELFELKLSEVILSDLISDAVHCDTSKSCANCTNFGICNALCKSHQYVQGLIRDIQKEKYEREHKS